MMQKASSRPCGWTQERRDAFEQLRTTLISHPVLISPEEAKPFTLHTDASGIGIGAVLSQDIDGTDKPAKSLEGSEFEKAAIVSSCLSTEWKTNRQLLSNPLKVMGALKHPRKDLS